MIKANKGRVELNGSGRSILIELATVVQGIYYALTEHAGNEPEEAHKAIMKAVKAGLTRKADVEKVKPSKKADDKRNALLERIMDFLEDEEAEDADDYD